MEVQGPVRNVPYAVCEVVMEREAGRAKGAGGSGGVGA